MPWVRMGFYVKRLIATILLFAACMGIISFAAAAEEPVYAWGKTIYMRCGSYHTHDLFLHPSKVWIDLNGDGKNDRDTNPEIKLVTASCTSPGSAWVWHKEWYSTPNGMHELSCVQTYTLQMEAFNHGDTKFTKTSEATCTANAKETGNCAYCGETVERDIPNTRIDHSFTTYTAQSDADCTHPATEIAYCDYGCGSSNVRNVGEVDPDAHQWGPWIIGENGQHVHTCFLNAEHQEWEDCESETACTECGRTPPAAETDEPAVPATGDNGMPMLWLTLMLGSCMTLLCLKRKKA